MNWRRAVFVVGVAAAFGFAVFLGLAWNATTIEERTASEADARFAAVLDRLGPEQSWLVRDETGAIVRRVPAPPDRPGGVSSLHVMAYRVRESRLVDVVVPFWFYRLKAPAAGVLAGGTGFDLDELGVTADDLDRHGPAVIFDERPATGDRLLVWTE